MCGHRPDRKQANFLSAFFGPLSFRMRWLATSAISFFLPHAAHANDAIATAPAQGNLNERLVHALTLLDRHELTALAVTFGLIAFAVTTSISLLRTRARAEDNARRAQNELTTLRAEIDRARALLFSEPQVVISWPAGEHRAHIAGDTTILAGDQGSKQILAFGTWLAPEPALTLDRAVDALRNTGESFSMHLTTRNGRAIEAIGRAIGGQAVVRLRELTALKREIADLAHNYKSAASEVEALRSFLAQLPVPAWARRKDGSLSYVNAAYVRALDARDENDVLTRAASLLDSEDQQAMDRALAERAQYHERVPIVVSGDRRMFDVYANAANDGSVALAVDISEATQLKNELRRMAQAHRRSLDQLVTAVAIFDDKKRLAFHNEAYRRLWDLDPAFLDNAPDDSAILDHLRAARKLPEEQDFRAWKQRLHEAYRAIEPHENIWHLPDGRTLRVITTPNPEGGVTYLFENVTERLDLERRFDSLMHVQRETLDNLAEAVAVFGSNGRIELHNPAFVRMWNLREDDLDERPHIDTIIAACLPLCPDEQVWQALRAPIISIEQRGSVTQRIERRDGGVVDCTTMPLPDGATLLAFHDITDSVHIERALRERNEALETAGQMKVNFVHHVSYELRSPLTTIIGFAHFLDDPATGPLNDKQRDYLSYITVSTNALLAIINNILDLATIDAGAMTLNVGTVDIEKSIRDAAEGIQDRLVNNHITLKVEIQPGIGAFQADERRIVQVLYNLLANAAGFSPSGSTIIVSASRDTDHVRYAIKDSGPGIPADMKDKVFDWFESHANGSQHRGAGLGLSLVRSFVELHGGRVQVDSEPGQGTTVTCIFPAQSALQRNAAE